MKRARTREILDRHGLHLRRELGQNFLVDEPWAARLVELAGVEPGDLVVEVGTGLGALTCALAERAQRVVTIEIDAGVVRALREEALLPEQVELLHADALRSDLGALVAGSPRAHTRLVANLPYSAATPLLRRMLDLRDCFASWSVMLQREVGARLSARPGSRDYGSLAVLHSLAAKVSPLAELPPGCFFPEPRVISSFLCVEPRDPAEISADELLRVERVMRVVFGQRRKTIANGLRAAGFAAESAARALESLNIEPRVRAETLEPELLRALVRALHEGET